MLEKKNEFEMTAKEEKIIDICTMLDCIKNGGFKQYNFYSESNIKKLSELKLKSLDLFYDRLKIILENSYIGGKK